MQRLRWVWWVRWMRRLVFFGWRFRRLRLISFATRRRNAPQPFVVGICGHGGRDFREYTERVLRCFYGFDALSVQSVMPTSE
jgi:hypothetical protein